VKIKGYFGRFDAPFVKARLVCARLAIDSSVRLLIDTGATETIISDNDALRLGIDNNQLQKLKKGVTGIGGEVETYSMSEVKLLFEADEQIYQAEFDKVLVTKHNLEDERVAEMVKWIPSLLGRDFLNRFSVIIDKRVEVVLITDEYLI